MPSRSPLPPQPPQPLRDPARLRALARTGLEGGASDPVLEVVSQLAAERLGVPIALVSLVGETEQRFPGMTGLAGPAAAARGTAVERSFCQHVVRSGAPLIVPDAREHPLVRDGGAGEALGVRAYAGLPLTTATGETIGALCAMDTAPRAWSAEELDQLRELAVVAMSELDTRIALGTVAEAAGQLPAADAADAGDAAAAVSGPVARERRTTSGIDVVDTPTSVRQAERPEELFTEIHRRGDRWMARLIAVHVVLAVALAPVHGTWVGALVVIALAAGGFALCMRRWPGAAVTRMVAGGALQAFCALHIHQLSGLAEMHFFFFTATTAMIIYQDWRALWPGPLAMIVQHLVFAAWHNAGVHPGGVPFFVGARVGWTQMAFHLGIACLQCVVASYWAELLRRRTLRSAAAHQRLEEQATVLRQHVRTTRASEARLRALNAASPVGIFHSDLLGNVTYVNARAQQLWQGTEDELLGRGWVSRVHPDDRASLVRDWQRALAAGLEAEREYRVVRPDGSVRRILGRTTPLLDPTRLAVGTVGTLEDVTERRAAEEALATSERRFRTVVESIDQGLLITDCDDRIVYANTRAGEITGHAPSELVGRVGYEVIVPEAEREAFLARMATRMQGTAERYELEIVRKDGTRAWTENGGVPFRDESGAIVGTIGVMADISARKRLEAALVRQAFEDSLTGLANRARLHERMEAAVARATPGREPAVLLVDLDEFKHVNDSLGHAAGDALLALVAERLLDATRGSDTVARLGGDEFAVLLAAVRGPGEATRVAERIVAVLNAPFALHEREVRVGASVGIAVRERGEAPDDLLRNADLALYRAKSAGRGGHALFVPAMHAAAVARLELEGELRRALEREELRVWYQPIVDLDTGAVAGVEALVRWRHPVRGLIAPGTFIPLAEATGLIGPIGRWVLRTACQTAAGWRATAHGAPPTVAVNVSARQLQQEGFVDEVLAALAESGLPAERLVLEVTESIVVTDLDRTVARLEALRARGVCVSLDDFGTGYSSLAYLQRLPVDVLKVDRAFTAELTAGGRGAAFARGVLTFATTLGMRTVAEGVETEAQHGALCALGCEYAQGYLYARPVEAAALAALLARRGPLRATEGVAATPSAVAAIASPAHAGECSAGSLARAVSAA